MGKIVKGIVTYVFSAFVAITFFIFVFSESFSADKLCIIAVIAAVIILYGRFPVISKWKIKRIGCSSWHRRCIVIPSHYMVYFVKAIPISISIHTTHLQARWSDGDILYQSLSLYSLMLGYSKFFQLFIRFFGPQPDSAVAFNIVLNTGILFLIYYIGKILHDEKTGIISAVIYAFWPSQVFYNSLVLTEPFFTFGILFLIAFYLYTIKHIKNTIWKIPAFLFIGITAGFLKYIRPAIIILILSFLIHYLLLEHKFNLFGKDRRKESLTRTGICILLILSYTTASSLLLSSIDNLTGIKTARKTSGFYILAGLNSDSEGRWSEKDSALLESLINEGLTSDQIHEQLTEIGLKRLKEMNLFSFIKLQVYKNKHMWGNDYKSITYIQNSVSPESRVNMSKHGDWLAFAATDIIFFSLYYLRLFFAKTVWKKSRWIIYFVFIYS